MIEQSWSMSRSRYSLIILRKTTMARMTLYRNRQKESMLVWWLSCWRKGSAQYSPILSRNNRQERRLIDALYRGTNVQELQVLDLSLAFFVPSFLSFFLPSAILLYLVYGLPVSLAPPGIDSWELKAPRFQSLELLSIVLAGRRRP